MCFNLCFDLFSDPPSAQPLAKASSAPVTPVVPKVNPEAAALIGKFITVPPSVTPSKYRIDKLLGSGGFGLIFLGRNVTTKDKVAIKAEKKEAPQRQLYLEFGFYERLGKPCTYAPAVFVLGHVDGWYALVMQLLGPSLLKMMDTVGGTLSVTCTAAVAVSLFEIFSCFHEKGLLFRDVKPENFLLGLPGTVSAHLIYIIDLGLCKEWRDERGEHIPNTGGGVITGTPAYMSIACHLGRQLSRRDDLESLMYMLIYLRTRSLPWLNLEGEDALRWEERATLFGQIKEKTSADELCSQMEPSFTQIYKAIRNLAFTMTPDYKGYSGLLMKTLQEYGIEAGSFVRAYDWNASHQKRPNQKLRNNPSRNRLAGSRSTSNQGSKASLNRTRSLRKKSKETKKTKMSKVSKKKKTKNK